MLWQWRLYKCEKLCCGLKLRTSVGLLYSKAAGEEAALPSGERSQLSEELTPPPHQKTYSLNAERAWISRNFL